MIDKYKKQNNIDVPGTQLEYKEHSEFFDTFYRIRNTFQISFAASHTDTKQLKVCFQNLQALIMLTTGQISKVVKINSVRVREKEIQNLVNTNNNQLALDKLRNLHDDLSEYWTLTEILPKVKEESIDENRKFWKDETNAGLREMKKAFFDSFMLPND